MCTSFPPPGADSVAHRWHRGVVETGTAVRVDRWLWAIRLFKSRSEATDACRSGHVKVNGRNAKPAATVDVGDRVEARIHGRDRVVEVVQTINNRVGAP